MKPLLTQIASVLGCILCLYAVLWGISMILVPPRASDLVLDTSQASHTIYMTEPKYIYLDRRPLEQSGAKVNLVGASNTVVGFRQADLATLIHGATVNNMAIGGANITEAAQVVDLATQTETPESLHRTTFVIGVWYGMFASNRDWWYSPDRHGGDTDIDIERYRYGFCWRTAQGPVPLIPPRDIDTAALAIHPYLVAEKLVRDVTTYVDERWLGRTAMRSIEERNEATVDEAEREKLLAYWIDRMGSPGSIPAEQFRILDQLISRTLASGADVLLVDLPLPNWHATRTPYLKSYYRQLQSVVDTFQGKPGFRFARLNGLSDDSDFSDEVHPKPLVSPEWSRQLAKVLNQDPSMEASLEEPDAHGATQEPSS